MHSPQETDRKCPAVGVERAPQEAVSSPRERCSPGWVELWLCYVLAVALDGCPRPLSLSPHTQCDCAPVRTVVGLQDGRQARNKFWSQLLLWSQPLARLGGLFVPFLVLGSCPSPASEVCVTQSHGSQAVRLLRASRGGGGWGGVVLVCPGLRALPWVQPPT